VCQSLSIAESYNGCGAHDVHSPGLPLKKIPVM